MGPDDTVGFTIDGDVYCADCACLSDGVPVLRGYAEGLECCDCGAPLDGEPKPEPWFSVEIDGTAIDLIGAAGLDGSEVETLRFSNPDKENGFGECGGALSWLNSARVTLDRDDDAVHCVVSVGDPRGGFCFTVRRTSDGRILLCVPHEGEGAPHLSVCEVWPGTLEVK